MRIVLAALLVPCAMAVLVGLVLLAPTPGEYGALLDRTRDSATANGAAAAAAQQSVDGEVLAAGREADCTDPNLPAEPGAGCSVLTVRLEDGPPQAARSPPSSPPTRTPHASRSATPW